MNQWLRLFVMVLVFLFVIVFPVEALDQSKTQVTIMATSDIHGHVFPIDYEKNKPANIGLAKIATLISQIRKHHPDALLLDSGDVIQGTPMEYYHARIDNQPIDPMMLAMNHLHYDAMAMGNHEFNYGREVREKARKEARFPWLAANVVIKGTDHVYTQPYKMISLKNGLRIGVLGLTTQKVPKWEDSFKISNLSFQDVVIAAKKWVPIMKQKEHADVIIVLYHGGLEQKKSVTGNIIPLPFTNGENQVYQLANQVPGIDVILAGHMHVSMANVFVHGVLVTEPNKWGTYLSLIQLDMQKMRGSWQVKKKSSSLQKATSAPDPKILSLVRTYEQKSDAYMNRSIGKIVGKMEVLNPLYVRTHDNPLIEFINKVQMDATGVSISATSLVNNKGKGLKSKVTYQDILKTYPFLNTLHVIKVTGKDIKQALEKTANYFSQNDGRKPIEVNPRYLTPKSRHFNYDMWEGIRYTIDVSKPEGSRIVGLTDLRGLPLEMSKHYQVVLNNYRAIGGGNYPMFTHKPIVSRTKQEVPTLIANYFRKYYVVHATVDENWEIVGGILPENRMK